MLWPVGFNVKFEVDSIDSVLLGSTVFTIYSRGLKQDFLLLFLRVSYSSLLQSHDSLGMQMKLLYCKILSFVLRCLLLLWATFMHFHTKNMLVLI